MGDFINEAVKLSIYDELVDVATKSILQNFPHYFEDGLDNLDQTSLDKITTGLATSSWVGDARNCMVILYYLGPMYIWELYLEDDFGDVIKHRKKKLLDYLMSKSSKEEFIKMIKLYASNFFNGDEPQFLFLRNDPPPID